MKSSPALLPVATASITQTANTGVGPGLHFFLKLLGWSLSVPTYVHGCDLWG